MDSTFNLSSEEQRFVDMPHPITLKLYQDEFDSYYDVRIPMLEGCLSDGATIKEALESIYQAKEVWISCALDNNIIIPEPENVTPIIIIENPYTKEEILKMYDNCKKFSEIVEEVNEKYHNITFLNHKKKKR